MKEPKSFPYRYENLGVTATIYRQSQTKPDRKGNPQTYNSYVVSFSLLGRRKQTRCSTWADAEAAAERATESIANGQQMTLELTNEDRLVHLRAKEAVEGIAPIDVACQGFAEVMSILGGRVHPAEAARYWLSNHQVDLPRITVAKAVEEMIAQSRADGKSDSRLHQLETYLNRFKTDFNCDVADVQPSQVSDYIRGLRTKADDDGNSRPVSERTKKNCRDIIDAFFRWCVGRGYLPKGEDMMEHVQNYRAKKLGNISIFTPEEMGKLLAHADEDFVPYLAIRSFAGVRGEEVQRLDWRDIDLEDGFITIHADIAKTNERRLVPIKDNLKEWLAPCAKRSGPVCRYANAHKQLAKLSKAAKVKWHRNALRHSCISYRVAECADVPRVADESGNSPDVIRTNYLRRVKPAQAVEWFNIKPSNVSK